MYRPRTKMGRKKNRDGESRGDLFFCPLPLSVCNLLYVHAARILRIAFLSATLKNPTELFAAQGRFCWFLSVV